MRKSRYMQHGTPKGIRPVVWDEILTIQDPPSPTTHTPKYIHYNRAAAAANPPNIPAPRPATFWVPAFFVAAAVVLEEVEEPVEEEADDEVCVVVCEDTEPLLGEVVTSAAVTVEDGAEDGVDDVLVIRDEVQDTAVGTITPFALQISSAYAVAACWSASLHTLTKQHAILLMKLWFAQIQETSRLLHPAMLDPLVYLSTQGTWRPSISISLNQRTMGDRLTAQVGTPGNWA
jgi:hypothetical protein